MADLGGRPPFEPTDAMRAQVEIAAGAGMSHEEISIGLGISRPTLAKYFEAELSEGAYARRQKVLVALYEAALKGNVTAAREYLAKSPRAAAAPLPAAPEKQEKTGKKDQANSDAKTAATGTEWETLIGPKRHQPLQ